MFNNDYSWLVEFGHSALAAWDEPFPTHLCICPSPGALHPTSGIDEQFRQSVYSHIVFKKQVIENERPKSELKLNDGHFERLGEIKEETLESSP